MGDTVSTRELYAGEKRYIAQYTNVSDGTGEAAVKKLDISGLPVNSNGDAVTGVKINKVGGNVSGMVVNILADHSSDVLLWVANDRLGMLSFEWMGGIKDGGSGGAGDMLFTTVGHTAGDSYCLVIEYGLKY